MDGLLPAFEACPLEGPARDETVAEAERLLAWVAPTASRRAVEFGVARERSRPR